MILPEKNWLADSSRIATCGIFVSSQIATTSRHGEVEFSAYFLDGGTCRPKDLILRNKVVL
jgi:hypothetical protein